MWSAPRRTSRGGQRRYSDLAIETCLTLRTAYRLGLRQTQGLMGSIGTLMGLDIRVCACPSGVDSTGLKIFGEGEWLAGLRHTVASRKRLEHRSSDEASRVCACPSGGGQYRPQDLRRRSESTVGRIWRAHGLKWLAQKHKTKGIRRRWRKLHLGLDLASGAIVCANLTHDDVGDSTAFLAEHGRTLLPGSFRTTRAPGSTRCPGHGLSG